MAVILGRHGRDLALGGTVGFHVQPAHGGVDLHELAEGLVRGGTGWHLHALTHFHQGLVIFLGPGDVPAAFEYGKRPGLVRDIHLLGAQCQGHVGGTCLQALQGQIESRAARGAGILHVVDGYALDPVLAQHHLSGDGYLALQGAIGHAGIECNAEVGPGTASILQGPGEGFPRHVLQGTVRVAPEDRHGYTRYVNIAHARRTPFRLCARCPASSAPAGLFSAPCPPCCAAAMA